MIIYASCLRGKHGRKTWKKLLKKCLTNALHDGKLNKLSHESDYEKTALKKV